MPARTSVRRTVRRTLSQVAAWRPSTRTALRIERHQRPPPRRAFAAYGEGSWLVPPVTVVGPERIEVGAGVTVMEHGSFVCLGHGDGGGRIRLGDGVTLTRFASIVAEVEVVVEDEVMSSDGVAIVDTWRSRHPGARGALPPPAAAPVRIGRGAYLGMNSIVGPGVTVGQGAFVGEGAVVLDDVPAHAVVYGSPARVVREHRADGTWHGPDFHRRELRGA